MLRLKNQRKTEVNGIVVHSILQHKLIWVGQTRLKEMSWWTSCRWKEMRK